MLNRESQESIINYCDWNERFMQKIKSKRNFHSTVYHSSNYPIFPDPKLLHGLNDKLPILLDDSTYFFDIFENCLVLRYEDERVREINRILIQDLTRQKKEVWPNLNPSGIRTADQFPKEGKISLYSHFNPHITFSKKFSKKKLGKLPPFKEFLVLQSTNFVFKS